MSNKIRSMLIVLICLLLPLLCFAESGKVVTPNGGKLKVRRNPDQKAKLVTTIPNGSSVEILNTENGWCHITFHSLEGYVQEQFIRVLSSAVGTEVYSNGKTLYLHESADADSSIIGMINAQQAMKVERIDADWAFVSYDQIQGYIPASDIDQLNTQPVAAAKNIWKEGTLKKEIKLYKEPNQKSEVLSTWPKGTGVAISSYDQNWYLIQVLDEGAFGFSRKVSVELSAMPTHTELINESEFISAAKARGIAENALKKYSGFKSASLSCSQDSVLSSSGIRGPMFRFFYNNKSGQCVYAAYVHAYTGELLYTGDYSEFVYDKDISDLRTSPPKTTQEPQWWYDEEGNVVWDRTPEPQSGTDIGQSAARSVADRYLAAKYPLFSQMNFSRVSCRHATDWTEAGGFQVPYYQFDYYVNDGSGDSASEQLEFSCIVNAYTKEIEYTCAASLGEGNG